MAKEPKLKESMNTVAETAEYLRIKPQTLYLWIRQGRISGSKIGRFWYFTRAQVEEFIKAQSRPATAKPARAYKQKKTDAAADDAAGTADAAGALDAGKK